METALQGFRLSLQQRRAWQIQQASAVCACQSLIRLAGDLDVATLAGALADVVRRHEILRTAFQRVPGLKVPVQVVADAAPPVLQRIDLSHRQAAEQESEIDCFLELDRRQAFEMGKGSSLRAALFQLGESCHWLLLTLPPLCSDATTLRNLFREIANSYAVRAGLGEPLPDSMQYVDFSEWQNDWLAGEEAEEGKDYWRRWSFSELPDVVVPGENREPSTVFDCETLPIPLETSEVRAVRELAKRYEVAPRLVFLAAWQALLARLAGQSEVTVGVACDGRGYTEIEGSLGPFARTLPVRCAVTGLRFREILSRTEIALGEVEAWQDYFVAEEAIPSGESGNCLAFTFDFEEPAEEITVGGLRFSAGRQFHFAESFKLRLICSLTSEEGSAELQYDPHRYDRGQIARMAGQWRRLLSALLADPERDASDVDILDEAERRLLLEEWNATSAPFPEELGIHQLIEMQAVARPNAAALLWDEGVMTYGELNRRADSLARSLVDLGVWPGVVVGLCVDRTPAMVVGVLAVLKAGGAYVALDLDQPRTRLLHVLQETAPAVLLAPRPLLASLPPHAAQLVCWDDEPIPSTAKLPAADPQGLAYVVFTSGSTGRPKGVLISHRGVVNYLTFLRTTYGLGESDVVLQIPDLTFDSSVRDLLGPLAAGAQVVLVEKSLAKDPRTLLRKARERGVTCLLSVVPTMLRALLDAAADETVPQDQVRLILASGEVLRAADGAAVERVFGSRARLFNQYGPTECTMTSSFYPVPQGLEEGDTAALPIGRPIPNARFYLLDDRRLPVPVGGVGELYIGGVGLASGYLNAPVLTAARFVEDPFGAAPGSRLYRTGDLAVFRPDGVLEFRGRRDQQVKVRGVRIELEEIEAALLEHPAVQRVVAAAREDTPGDVRLAAYLVFGNGEQPPSNDELRLFLRERLPEPMVPAAFVHLETLPMTPNGKVDRNSLPAPEPETSGRTALPRAAQTPTEEIIAGIWSDVLKTENVHPADNFFSLGGHSLLSAQVILRINEAFQVAIPLRTLFDVPTVAGLARVVDEAVLSDRGVKAPPLRQVPRDGRALPLSFAQQRLWFMDQLHPGNPLFNLGSALRLQGPLDLAVLQRTLDEIVRRHETLRTTFASTEKEPVQEVAPPAQVPLRVVDLSGWEPPGRQDEASRLLDMEARRPFDLTRGPLVRALVVRESEAEHLLFLGLHHIISDAWSSRILFRELAVLYDAFSRGGTSPLPELPVQYADFAVWQREWLQGEVLEAELDFWKRQLDGAPAVLELPSDRPRPMAATFQSGRHYLELPPDLTRELAALCRKEGATTFMILLAAFTVTLRHLGAGDDVVVGADVANRMRAETEGLIGFFINQLVLRSDLSGDPTFGELLARVRRTAMDAYAHQDLPFDKLVEALRPERSLNHAPLFQVKLVLQNNPRFGVELPSGLTVERMPLESTPAREDLLLNVNETGEGIAVSFKYNADLFEARTIARVACLFETVLRRAASEPGIRLGELDTVLAETDRESRARQAQEHASVLEQKLKTIRRRATSLEEGLL